jgi:hypothetical protein
MFVRYYDKVDANNNLLKVIEKLVVLEVEEAVYDTLGSEVAPFP